MIEDVIIGMFLGAFLVAGPQITWAFIRLRGHLSKALKEAGMTLDELKHQGKKK